MKEIFRLSVNHEQIPSIPMTHKSKHYNSGFKKWMQILAGENSSGATTDRPIEIQREQQRRRQQRKTPQQREHRFSLAQRRRSCQQETGKTRERLQRVEYVYRQLLWRNFFAASLFNSIQLFLNAEGQNTAITDASRKCRQYAMDSQRKRSGKVVHSWKFAVEIQLEFFDATIGSKNYT